VRCLNGTESQYRESSAGPGELNLLTIRTTKALALAEIALPGRSVRSNARHRSRILPKLLHTSKANEVDKWKK
jgi:hypothetical protein